MFLINYSEKQPKNLKTEMHDNFFFVGIWNLNIDKIGYLNKNNDDIIVILL